MKVTFIMWLKIKFLNLFIKRPKYDLYAHTHQWAEYKDEGKRVLLVCTVKRCLETKIINKTEEYAKIVIGKYPNVLKKLAKI